jgi:DNA-binding NarL/FixJ family response regulator
VRAGIVGYVLKNASAVEVADAIRSVAAGKAVCPPSLCLGLFRCVMQQTPSPQATAWGYDLGLSRREQETLELLRYRYTNKEIALRLNLSEQTVKNHVHHILHKLSLPNRFSVPQFYENEKARTDLHIVATSAERPRTASLDGPERGGESSSIIKPFTVPRETVAEG